MLKYGINIHYDWRKYHGPDYFLRCGPYVWLGFAPSVNFTRRASLSMDFIIGYGYLWSTDYYFTRKNLTYRYTQEGSYVFVLPSVKLNYKF